MLLADRMLQLELNHKYAEILELALYNTVMTGMSRDGKRFTYVNQLGSSDQDASKREDWFTCACCPPNVSRLLGSLGGYVWNYRMQAEQGRDHVNIDVHLFTSATVQIKTGHGDVTFSQRTDYPWSGDVACELVAGEEVDVTIRIRVPAWAGSYKVRNPCLSAGASLTFSSGCAWCRRQATSWLHHPRHLVHEGKFELRLLYTLRSPHYITTQRKSWHNCSSSRSSRVLRGRCRQWMGPGSLQIHAYRCQGNSLFGRCLRRSPTWREVCGNPSHGWIVRATNRRIDHAWHRGSIISAARDYR